MLRASRRRRCRARVQEILIYDMKNVRGVSRYEEGGRSTMSRYKDMIFCHAHIAATRCFTLVVQMSFCSRRAANNDEISRVTLRVPLIAAPKPEEDGMPPRPPPRAPQQRYTRPAYRVSHAYHADAKNDAPPRTMRCYNGRRREQVRNAAAAEHGRAAAFTTPSAATLRYALLPLYVKMRHAPCNTAQRNKTRRGRVCAPR